MPGRPDASVSPRQVDEIEAVRRVLGEFGVPERLLHVRDFVWRGGTLSYEIDSISDSRPPVYYQLSACWAAPVLERSASESPAIERSAVAVIEGQWVRGTAGYRLQVGIDLAAPSAISIRSDRLFSSVPYVNRERHQVEHALAIDLAAYVDWFLSTHAPVGVAASAAAARLRALKR